MTEINQTGPQAVKKAAQISATDAVSGPTDIIAAVVIWHLTKQFSA